MIDSVRATVLAICNKNNFGYISPSDFNLYAKQAQMRIFERMFSDYNKQINMENARQSGTDYAAKAQKIAQELETFMVVTTFAQASGNTYTIPSNCHFIPPNGVKTTSGGKIMEYLTQGELVNLNNSNLTAPSTTYPAYTRDGFTLTAYPTSINTAGAVTALYFRFPLDPKWTYTTLSGGEPVFNQSAGDYQDFELSADYEPELVLNILEMAGVSIREVQVQQFADADDLQLQQQDQ